jgi:hypothetical protein
MTRLKRVRECRKCGAMFDSNGRGYTVCDDCGKRGHGPGAKAKALARENRIGYALDVKEKGHASTCDLCGDSADKLVRDHDHTCHQSVDEMCSKCFRGWLCGRCNSGLGFFRDNPELMRRAALYVEHHRGVRHPWKTENYFADQPMEDC